MREVMRQFFSRDPWPHQMNGVLKVVDELKNYNAVTLCSATGAGKSDMMWALTQYYQSQGAKCLILTNRKMLTRQTMENAQAKNIGFGVRAASLAEHFDSSQDIQISSIQTEIARTINTTRWEPFDADYIFVDEGHLQASGESEKFLRSYLHRNRKVVGLSATPIGMSHLYPKLVVSGSPSECLACGSHVRAVIKAPFEFDLSRVGRVKTGEFNVGDIRKYVWSQQIVGRIIDEWRSENPEQRPTLVFAPCVETSIGLVNDFLEAGVKAAHIDAKKVQIGDKSYTDSDGTLRQEIMESWKAGDIKVICNRFVLREGIDLPQMYHLILACPMGSIKTYLQSTGRVIRYSKETPHHVLITDHAGNYWRWGGGPNRDRNWEEMYYQTSAQIEKKIREQAESNPGNDPIICPYCNTARHAGMPSCPAPPYGCGREAGRQGKKIIQSNGQLKVVTGPNVKAPKVRAPNSADQTRWDGLYFRSRNSQSSRAMNFNQLKGAFYRQYGYQPPEGLLRMPKDEATWSRKVRDVPSSSLRSIYDAEQS
jgi:superfamily II DNA or RNA helicase